MMLKIFSVYDTKSETYARPFYDVAKGSAVRNFADIAKDKQHPIGQHPADYVLFEIGEFDDKTCGFTILKAPVNLGVAIEFLRVEPDMSSPLHNIKVASNG